MSKGERKPRRKSPVNPKPQEYQTVTRTIRIPKPSPEAQRICESIRTIWPQIICEQYRLMEIIAKVEIASRFITDLACLENDYQAVEIERMFEQAKRDLYDIMDANRRRSFQILSDELGLTKAQVIRCGKAAGFAGF